MSEQNKNVHPALRQILGPITPGYLSRAVESASADREAKALDRLKQAIDAAPDFDPDRACIYCGGSVVKKCERVKAEPDVGLSKQDGYDHFYECFDCGERLGPGWFESDEERRDRND